MKRLFVLLLLWGFTFANAGADQKMVQICLNYPATGPYAREGLDQYRGAEMARVEINAAGGILGKKIDFFQVYDSQSNPDVSAQNVVDAIQSRGVSLVLGGVSSVVAFKVSKICQDNSVLYFPVLTHANETTGEKAHRALFRGCLNADMSARVLASYLKKNFEGKKFFYIVADYSPGWSIEAAYRKYTNTENPERHPCVRTPFPNTKGYEKALFKAKQSRADVLILGLIGEELANAMRKAEQMGLKQDMQFIVPSLSITGAERSTPKAMEGIIGVVDWAYPVPYAYDYNKGIAFVEKFAKRTNRYPSTHAAYAYTLLYEYKYAVERAGSFGFQSVVKSLEGHPFQSLKDKQVWRDFDHQCIQTLYIVRCKKADIVLKDKYHMDYFEIIDSMPGEQAAISYEAWAAIRRSAGLPTDLEKFPNE